MEADRANRLYEASERRVIQLEAALKRIAKGELASVVKQQAARIEQLEAALRDARGALATIHNNTEPDAIKHRDYGHLAASIYNCAKDALDGNFVDDMHAAEVYDKLYPRAALDQSSPPKAST
jgi:uncharacterized membrane protein YccC